MKCLCIFLISSSWAVRTKTAVFTLSALLTSALCCISSSKQSLCPSAEHLCTGVQSPCFSAKPNQFMNYIHACHGRNIHPSIHPIPASISPLLHPSMYPFIHPSHPSIHTIHPSFKHKIGHIQRSDKMNDLILFIFTYHGYLGSIFVVAIYIYIYINIYIYIYI